MGLTQAAMHVLLGSYSVPPGVVYAFALPTATAKVIIVSFIFKEVVVVSCDTACVEEEKPKKCGRRKK